MATDYERKVQTSETLIQLAMTRLLLRRLAVDASHMLAGEAAGRRDDLVY
jgi:hypothetical protein